MCVCVFQVATVIIALFFENLIKIVCVVLSREGKHSGVVCCFAPRARAFLMRSRWCGACVCVCMCVFMHITCAFCVDGVHKVEQ